MRESLMCYLYWKQPYTWALKWYTGILAFNYVRILNLCVVLSLRTTKTVYITLKTLSSIQSNCPNWHLGMASQSLLLHWPLIDGQIIVSFFRYLSKPQEEFLVDQVFHWVKSMEHLPQIDPRKKELFEARFLIQKRGGGSNPISSPTTGNLIAKVRTYCLSLFLELDGNLKMSSFLVGSVTPYNIFYISIW